MKTPKRNIFLLSLFLALLMSSYACMLLIDEKPMIFTGDPEEEFLGIPWGCSFEELQKVLDESPFPTKFKKVDCSTLLNTYQYRGNHHLPHAKYSAFMFWEGKLSSIHVLFFEKSENYAKAVFDSLKKDMKKEWSELTEEIKKGYLVRGIEDEVDSGYVYGSKGELVSFELWYGGDRVDLSDTSVVLSAESNIHLKERL